MRASQVNGKWHQLTIEYAYQIKAPLDGQERLIES